MLGKVGEEESHYLTQRTAFGSTYEREVAFGDNEWIKRVTNPVATTFVAVLRNHGNILSSATLAGPLPIPDDLAEKISGLPAGILHWKLVAVYTRPEARRTGLAREVLKSAWEWAQRKSASQGSSCVVSTDAMQDNCSARALYERFGFSVVGESDGIIRMVRCDNNTSGPSRS